MVISPGFQATFSSGIGQAGILDVGFIGNTSGFYMWEPGILELKEQARQHGYANLMPQARDHEEKYLQELLSRIPAGVWP